VSKRNREKRLAKWLTRPDNPVKQRPMPPLVRGTFVRHSERIDTSGRAVCYQNEHYAVAVYEPKDGITHMSVQRLDGTPARDWRDLQNIKNELVHPERSAIEVYPPESCVVDLSNTTHIYVLPKGVMVDFLGGRHFGGLRAEQ
jgi:hypothetical protein